MVTAHLDAFFWVKSWVKSFDRSFDLFSSQIRENENFGQKTNFGQKSKFWSKNKFWSIIKILVKNQNFGQQSKFWSKIKIFVPDKNGYRALRPFVLTESSTFSRVKLERSK